MSLLTPSATDTPGARLAAAIANRDQEALHALLATPIEFRAVTPRRFWDAGTAIEAVDIVLGIWFDPTKQVTDVTVVEDDVIGDVRKITYRMSVSIDAGSHVVEQVAYYTEKDDRITHLRLVCSGFRSV